MQTIRGRSEADGRAVVVRLNWAPPPPPAAPSAAQRLLPPPPSTRSHVTKGTHALTATHTADIAEEAEANTREGRVVRPAQRPRRAAPLGAAAANDRAATLANERPTRSKPRPTPARLVNTLALPTTSSTPTGGGGDGDDGVAMFGGRYTLGEYVLCGVV